MKIHNFISFKLMACMFFLCVANGTLAAKDIDDNDQQTETKADQTFYLVYIAQGSQEEMPVEALKKQLEVAWGKVTSGPVIFYLSKGNGEPAIVKANCKDDANIEEERKLFEEKILDRLQDAIQYSVNGTYDKQRLLNLLYKDDENDEGMDIVDESGMLLYKETCLEFHVGQDFWESGNQETILASLFFELNIRDYFDDGKIHFNVYCPKNLNVNNSDARFGILNPDDCKKYINLEKIY